MNSQRCTCIQWENQLGSVQSYDGGQEVWAFGDDEETLEMFCRERSKEATFHTGSAGEKGEEVHGSRSTGWVMGQRLC